ncbi:MULTISPECIES: adenylate/guanylate cyclase domain-containing protein [unclassified Sphingomonas]|uniref:adenylate/guanylate cyclase domain-containing protein n=1 Tax=Sphingomonas sp. PvP015 TaxID=3156388 RepID=UPI00339730A2
MAIGDDLRTQVRNTFQTAWTTRDGTVVPATADVKLSNDGVNLDATVLYADLSESTQMVDSKIPTFSAEVYKNYLYCAARLIRNYEGSITAYDGDRIMGVFVGDRKNTNAARCSLAINWAVENVIRDELSKRYTTDFVLRHTVGIDTAKLLVARTGVRGDNDLVWVGRAANWAAKLTGLPNATPLWLTKRVYDNMNDSVKTYNGKQMWSAKTWTANNNEAIYSSTWNWAP